MKLRFALVITVAQILAIAAGASAQGLQDIGNPDEVTRSYVSGAGKVFAMMPPVLISGPIVIDAAWSPDAGCLAIKRASLSPQVLPLLTQAPDDSKFDPAAQYRPPQVDIGEEELLLYTRGKATVLWKGPASKEDISRFEWATSSILVSTVMKVDSEKPYTVMVTRLAKSQITTTTLPASADEPDFETSPNQGNVLVVSDGVLYFFRANGDDSQVKVDDKDLLEARSWAADGGECYVGGNGPDGEKWFALGKRELVRLDKRPALAPLQDKPRDWTPAGPLQTAFHKTPLKSSTGQTVTTTSLWLEDKAGGDKQMPGLVAGDVRTAWLSPQGNGVFYITKDDALFVRAISGTNIKPDDLAKQRVRAVQMTAVANSKRVGHILQSRVANDKSLDLPAWFESMSRLDMPDGSTYDFLEGFQYTYAGGSYKDIAKPAETVIGYTAAEGGQAVLYADGHVTWQPTSR